MTESTGGVPDALLFPFLSFDEETGPASEWLEVIVIGNPKRLWVAEAASESRSVPDCWGGKTSLLAWIPRTGGKGRRKKKETARFELV